MVMKEFYLEWASRLRNGSLINTHLGSDYGKRTNWSESVLLAQTLNAEVSISTSYRAVYCDGF